MTKKDVTLSIEENLLKNAKKQIPNLSAFFEECLKNYMGMVNGLYPTAKYKEMLEKVNKLGIGPQGFGGKTTAIGLNIETMPTHIAGMPCAVNINCHVTRHKSEVI